MIAGDMFSLKFKNYMNQTLIAFLKQFISSGGSKWIPEQKQWVISFVHYDAILAQVVRLVGRDMDGYLENADTYNNPS